MRAILLADGPHDSTGGPLTLDLPTAALPLQIFAYAISPYESWHSLAWAGALVLISMVLIISIVARAVTRSRFGAPVD